ncbi:MAG: hypothetical protein AMXMBFR84_41580 [Candidatus Hydrogenedentota bacterium]
MVESTLLHDAILEVLIPGPDYGYSIAQTIKQRTPGLLDAREGLLYAALYELESCGYLVSYESRTENAKRRHYKLTERGIVRALELRGARSVIAADYMLKPLHGMG